jgi:hypothetical protein
LIEQGANQENSMNGAQNDRRYEAGDTVKLEIVLHHRANFREVRVVFLH